ncbi:hypothetical protein BXZ70DRAFT_1044712 [Cristinia sonorae]|uniref:Uncharacterized protein n=1 Tax=Cristinia sonorae TaxID=1940300 RepID=A0A8K0UH72_9AGAR|nr:hypothetical protein BXZ70DRAFT_1044712 [Cristinia sonorae]
MLDATSRFGGHRRLYKSGVHQGSGLVTMPARLPEEVSLPARERGLPGFNSPPTSTNTYVNCATTRKEGFSLKPFSHAKGTYLPELRLAPNLPSAPIPSRPNPKYKQQRRVEGISKESPHVSHGPGVKRKSWNFEVIVRDHMTVTTRDTIPLVLSVVYRPPMWGKKDASGEVEGKVEEEVARKNKNAKRWGLYKACNWGKKRGGRA